MPQEFKRMSLKVSTIIKTEDNFYVMEEITNNPPYNYIISKMNQDYQRILYSDYVDNLGRNWYKSYYSKSTYYRLKKRALIEFLKLYETL